MSYLGKSPGVGIRRRYYFTATGGETSLSGTDDNGATLLFSDGDYVDVMLNGATLVAGADYNTTTVNTIGGLAALSASAIVQVVVHDVFSVADTVSKLNGGTFDGAVSFGSTVTADGLTVSAAVPSIQMTDTANNADAYIQATDGNLRFYADDNAEAAGSLITFSVDGGEKVRIDDSGNVG